jgi:EcsC protein family
MSILQLDIAEDDRAALEQAVTVLENPNWITRLAGLAGKPVEMIGSLTPKAVSGLVTRASQKALTVALRLALTTLTAKPLWRSELLHKVAAASSGAMGGAFGLATLPVELPVSTTLILRSIAEIARQEGEDLSDPEAALACVQVFALGSGREDVSPAESSYFAVRAALAQTMSEAAHFITEHGVAGQGAPVMIRLASEIASRFGFVISQKVAAQAVPVIGALGGAAVNATFMDHYQDLARAHFTVRRLERTYGREVVRQAYDDIRQRAGGGPAPGDGPAFLPRPPVRNDR